ncbi:26S proteasome subunit P45 family protein [Cooperia oncophora]
MGNRLGAVPRKREKPEHAALKVSMKRVKGLEHVNKMPNIIPRRGCLLRLLKQNRVHDYLLLETEFIKRQNQFKSLESQKREERKVVQQLRGTPTTLAKVHELFNDEQHAVVVVEGSKREWFIPILSIVDKDLLHLNALVMVKASGMFKNVPTAIVGVLPDSTDSCALGHKLEKPPKETFEDIGGLEGPIQEMKESVELPLTHPEYYEEMGITAPKGVILYGEPGTGKTLLAKAVANSTSATFIRATGADLVQKNSGDGAKLVRELFKMAKESAPCIVFLDEIDAVGTKRFDTSSRGEQEVQRTLLELLNQLDGFESRGDVKIHTSGMNLAKDVTYDVVMSREGGKTMSGAEIKAVCTEAGMLALRAQRKVVCADDFEKAVKNVMLKNKGGAPDEIYG